MILYRRQKFVMEVVSSQDVTSDKNNNTNLGAKQLVTGTRVNLKMSPKLHWNSSSTVNTVVNRSVTEHEDDAEEASTHARVGVQYQAVLPVFIHPCQRVPGQCEDTSLQCWSPYPHEDEELEHFMRIAMDKFRYSREQAMAMLFWHNHNMYEALQDLPNFAPKPSEWDFDDKLRFEQGLQIHGKSFHLVQEMLPEKSIASLVEYYYGRTSSRLRVINRRRWTMLKEGSAEYGGDSDGGDDQEEEPSSSFSDWDIRNALYEKHCQKNHSDFNREQRSSCPICLKKVLNKEVENYQCSVQGV